MSNERGAGLTLIAAGQTLGGLLGGAATIGAAFVLGNFSRWRTLGLGVGAMALGPALVTVALALRPRWLDASPKQRTVSVFWFAFGCAAWTAAVLATISTREPDHPIASALWSYGPTVGWCAAYRNKRAAHEKLGSAIVPVLGAHVIWVIAMVKLALQP